MERLKIPITALSMLKNILGVECKGFENKRIAVNNIKKKNIMLRLYFENNKSSSDLNSNNIFEADSLPIPGRKEYSCLGEVVEEFVSNWDHIMYTIDRIIKKNTLLYQEHSDTDHSDMDSHCDDFYAFDWGDGYTVYIYKYRVEMGIIVSLTKEFAEFNLQMQQNSD